MKQYHYDGLLSKDTIDSILDMTSIYPNPVEVTAMPDHKLFDMIFSDRSYVAGGEDCMGQPTSTERGGIPYGFVPKNFADPKSGGFIFLPDVEAHARFIEAFYGLVVKPHPFTTSFGGPG